MLKSLFKQINLLNGLLLAGIVAFVWFAILPIFTVEVKVPSIVPPKTAEQKKDEAAEQAVQPPAQEYAVLAEHNLFHPDRIIPTEKSAETAASRPDFILYGTLITDNVSIAYLNDKKAPRTTAGRGKRQIALKIGETLSGYTLQQVLPDRVVLAHGDDKIEVKLTDPGSRKERGTEAASQTQQTMPMMQTSPAMPTTRGSAMPGFPTTQPATPVGRTASTPPQPAAGTTSAPGNTTGLPPELSGPPPRRIGP